MKIVFITITFDPEPGALRGLPLAKWLTERGHEVKVLTAFPQYPEGRIYPGYKMKLWQWEKMDGISVLRVPIFPSHDTSAIKRILTYLSFALSATFIGLPHIGSADVIYLYEPPPTNGLASWLMKLFRGTPIVHHIADMWPETVVESGMLKSEAIKWFANLILGGWCKFLYRQAAIMTVLSPGFKRLLAERGVPETKTKVIYNWTDEAVFRPVEYDSVLAAALGFTGHFNVVYAGNLGPLQNIETLIKAAALLKDIPEIQIVIIGTGPKEKQVKALASKLNVTNVRFIQRMQYWDMPKVNRLSDAMVVHLKDLHFLHSTIPSKTQVGLASGRPMLMALKGDAADIVRNANAGLICPPDNPEAMAAAIKQLFDLSPQSLEEMGNRGREYYLKNLCLDVAGMQMEDALYEAISLSKESKKEKKYERVEPSES